MQRRRLARAGRADAQHHAVGAFDRLLQLGQVVVGHAEPVQHFGPQPVENRETDICAIMARIVVQSERALANGVGMRHVLQFVREFRVTNQTTPVVLMGYANPIEHMGADRFIAAAKEAGVDGVLVVDYPPEECENFALKMKENGLDPIFLLAPTSTDERIEQVGKIASGYVYYVSLKGVTGSGHLDLDAVASKLPAIRKHVKVPVGVGFGIRDAATAKAIGSVSDAVVIGSRIIQELENTPRENAAQAVKTFIAGIRTALDELQ